MEGHRNRKPLSDITNNYNLIPTSALRKLASASTNPSSFLKPTLSILKSSSVSSNQKFCSESSNRSDTSIGSSNVTGAWNSRTVHFRTPPCAISSITPPGGRVSKDTTYNGKQMTEKNTKEREAAAAVIVSPTSVEKRKNKGKAIAVPFSSSPPEKLKENQNEVSNPGTLEREKQKGTAYRNLFGGLVEIAKESTKGTPNSYSCSYGKTKKGKAVLNSSGCAIGKQEEMAKGIINHSSYSLEKTIDGKKMTIRHSGSSNDGKKGILKRSGLSIVKTKETAKELVNPTSFLVEKTKEKGKPLNRVGSSIEKTREKGKAILQSSDVVEVTKPKGSSAAVTVNSRPPPRRKSEKRKNDAGASSFPPMTRTKNLQFDLDEDGDIKSSKSWTDAQPKLKKKRSRIKDTNDIPLDFIKQQRAYFKEVDDFDLPEEEVSEDELD